MHKKASKSLYVLAGRESRERAEREQRESRERAEREQRESRERAEREQRESRERALALLRRPCVALAHVALASVVYLVL
jgi:F0F1-type ATP synthase membrane subunit b/b'